MAELSVENWIAGFTTAAIQAVERAQAQFLTETNSVVSSKNPDELIVIARGVIRNLRQEGYVVMALAGDDVMILSISW